MTDARRRTLAIFAPLAAVAALGLAGAAPQAFAQAARDKNAEKERAVYHIDDAQAQGLKGLRNVRNHLEVAPDTQIVVVTHAQGVDMLMEDAKDAKSGTAYGPLVSALRNQGVRFEVCEITLRNRNLKKEQFTLDAEYTPSGVVRLARLQREGYSYIKP